MQSNSHSFNFGPNHLHVQEIIDFVESGSILQKPFDQSNLDSFEFELKLIGNLKNIEAYRGPYTENARIKRVKWIELLRDEIPKYLFEGLFAEDGAFKNLSPLFQKIRELFRNQLINQLKNILPSDEIDWIVDDMEVLVTARTSPGKNEFISEKLYEIYKAGEYPCGCEGAYPRGRLVVFVPEYSNQDQEQDHSLWELKNRETLKFGIGDNYSFPIEKYDYFAFRNEIGFVGGMLQEKYGIDEDTVLSDVAGEPIPLSNQ